MDNNDFLRLLQIKAHCEDIIGFCERFGKSFENYISDRAFYNSVNMSVLQIGELAGGLTEEYRKTTEKSIPWRMVRGMRNLLTHSYGEVDDAAVWDTVINDIPGLLAFCESQITSLR